MELMAQVGFVRNSVAKNQENEKGPTLWPERKDSEITNISIPKYLN